MATIPHESSPAALDRPAWWMTLLAPEMWATLAIVVIWIAVLFAGLYGPDIVSTTYLGDHTTVPSAVVIAPFAFFATWVVARYGYRRGEKRGD